MAHDNYGLDWPSVVGLSSLFGGYGGLARYLHNNSGGRLIPSIIRCFCEGLVGGFLGILVGVLCIHLQLEVWLSLFLAGFAGVTGWGFIDILTKVAKSRAKVVVGELADKLAEELVEKDEQ